MSLQMGPRTPILALLICVGCSEYKFAATTSTAPKDGAPAIEVDPLIIDFGLWERSDEPTDDHLVRVTNVGTELLTVIDVTLSAPTAPFDVTALSAMDLPPDESATLSVSFTPSLEGSHEAQVQITSTDPDDSVVAVQLIGEVWSPADTGEPPMVPEDPEDDLYPDIEVDPTFHDFGLLPVGDTESRTIDISNVGDALLVVDDVSISIPSGEMILIPDVPTNGPFPWEIDPGEVVSIWVDYAPTDDAFDEAIVEIVSNDPDQPVATATLVGNGRPFEGFSTGWYIWDDGIAYETSSSSGHPVEHHGDTDLYYYEPSGAHGLLGGGDPIANFAVMRDYVIVRAGSPSVVSGPLSFSSGSDLATFAYATFTYILCDFYIEPGDDPARYEVSANSVDDGIQVMVNGSILGHMALGDGTTSWSLADVGAPGAVNTLIVILVDDSRVDRYLTDLAFYKDGAMVE